MKLPSSPLIVYSNIYSILIIFATLLHFILRLTVSSPLLRLYIIDFIATCILFFLGNFFFLSNNIYDLHWPLLPLICSIYFFLTLDIIEYHSIKPVLLFILILCWSCHLIWQTVSSTENIQHEDWRYKQMRIDYKNHFYQFAFFALHILPMLEVLIGSSPIYYIYMNLSRFDKLTLTDALCLLVIFVGVLTENLADKQLTEFRTRKKTSRDLRYSVISVGLWKYSRHPNYLGELLFWWGLFFFGCNHDTPLWCVLGPLLTTLMMYFGSIPMSEERLFRKYPEYKFVQQNIPKLFPRFSFSE